MSKLHCIAVGLRWKLWNSDRMNSVTFNELRNRMLIDASSTVYCEKGMFITSWPSRNSIGTIGCVHAILLMGGLHLTTHIKIYQSTAINLKMDQSPKTPVRKKRGGINWHQTHFTPDTPKAAAPYPASICFHWGGVRPYLKLRVVHAPGIPETFSPPPTSKETAS